MFADVADKPVVKAALSRRSRVELAGAIAKLDREA
jgi:hypothetical protein